MTIRSQDPVRSVFACTVQICVENTDRKILQEEGKTVDRKGRALRGVQPDAGPVLGLCCSGTPHVLGAPPT